MFKSTAARLLPVALILAAPAEAQTTTYRVLDLGVISDTTINATLREIDFYNNHTVRLPFRMNSKGQVALCRSAGTSTLTWTPLLWLPEEDSSISLGPGLFNLTELDETDTEGIALDINESTQVCGARGAQISGERAIVWSFDSNGAIDDDLIDFTGSHFELNEQSAAHGLNDDDPPVVVGWATYDDPNCTALQPQPFRAALGSTPVDLGLKSGYYWGKAMSVNAAASPMATGIVRLDCNLDFGDHDINTEPQEWISSTVDDVVSIDDDYGAQTLKINEAGNIVGWAREPDPGPLGSTVVATFWDDSSTAPEELGNFDALSTDEQSIAYGVNETEPLTVVGASITNQVALAWFQDVDQNDDAFWNSSDTDLVVDLNDVLVSGCDSEWVLIEAFDVNDDGWIVGWGYRGADPTNPSQRKVHAFVLVDENEFATCAADLSTCPDGQVDVFDLFVLLENWGMDGPGADLAAPTDVVDVFDLFELLMAWGVCGQPPGAVAESAQDCYDKFQNDPEALEQCLWAIEQLN